MNSTGVLSFFIFYFLGETVGFGFMSFSSAWVVRDTKDNAFMDHQSS